MLKQLVPSGLPTSTALRAPANLKCRPCSRIDARTSARISESNDEQVQRRTAVKAPGWQRRDVSVAAAAGDIKQLKQDLLSVVEQNSGRAGFPQEAAPILEQIGEAATDVPQITADGIRGRYRQVLSNTSFVDSEGNLSLGTLTFNQFQPKDLKVHLFVDVDLLQGVEEPDQYSTEATFEILEGPLKGVRGLQKTLGRYEVTGETPGRQDVYFSGVLVKPKDATAEQVATWVETLKPHNPKMDESGAVVMEFPGGTAHGFRDFKINDDDLALTVGNRKSWVAVQPLS